eukprot:scaffold48315_cov57-Cyclotella_meneghiniana.AAC.1
MALGLIQDGATIKSRNHFQLKSVLHPSNVDKALSLSRYCSWWEKINWHYNLSTMKLLPYELLALDLIRCFAQDAILHWIQTEQKVLSVPRRVDGSGGTILVLELVTSNITS